MRANDLASSLRAPARAPATHAPIATPISRHDATAEAAGWGVAEVHDFAQRVGGVDAAGSQFTVFR
ncbi:MAG: hypothetical protein DMG75_13955, partial [Acidobacteria bacterium]